MNKDGQEIWRGTVEPLRALKLESRNAAAMIQGAVSAAAYFY